jgi:glycosyltransferase involved in cell wall biosynthesis
MKQFSAFIAIGKSNREFYVNRGVDPAKIVNGQYCVESERFAEKSEEARGKRTELRRKWSIPEDAICFIFSGKFEQKKRPMDILHALREVVKSEKSKVQSGSADNSDNQQPIANSQQMHSVHLLLVGDGVLKKACEVFACKHKLPVTLTGFLNQSELPDAYAAVDCLVLASDYGETWGLVVNEAMACGLPTIVSDHVGCHPDLVHPGLTGEVFEFGNVTALADCMRRLASNPDHLRCMGRDARERISAYSIENLTQATIDALHITKAAKRHKSHRFDFERI